MRPQSFSTACFSCLPDRFSLKIHVAFKEISTLFRRGSENLLQYPDACSAAMREIPEYRY
jgi:hypothetical protein